MRRAAGLLVLALVSVEARAQQGAADVGGQPARRKVTKLPRLTKFVAAEYPPGKTEARVEAHVTLVLELSETGRVTASRVQISGGEEFDRAAIDATLAFEFEPAEVDGKPAPSKITYRYDFVLKEEPPPRPPPPPAPPPPKTPPPPAPPPAAGAVEDITVVGDPRARRESTEIKVGAAQARLVAGTQGDVLKVVHNLPGVSRPPLASGQIVVWGAAPRDTRVYVDGVEIPALYHASGLRSTVNSDLVSSIDLVPGAFGAEYGRGLGGLVRVETRALPAGTHGYAGADTLDASALVSTSLRDGKIRLAIAARQSYVDRVVAGLSDKDVGDFFPIPRYRDYQAKVTVDLRPRESLDLVFLGSNDAIRRTVPSLDPAKTKSESTDGSYHRVYLRYARAGNDESVTVTPFYGRDGAALVAAFGGNPARLETTTDRYGVRALDRLRLRDGDLFSASLALGLDAHGAASVVAREGSLTLPPREGDLVVFGQPPGDEYAIDAYSTHLLGVAPHASADLALGPVTVTPGARVETFLVEVSRATPRVGRTPAIGKSRLDGAVDPRVAVRWQTTPRLAFTAAGGTYHQPPEPEDLSAVFGTPELGLSRATHVSLGESLRITSSLTCEVVGFSKTMKDLVVRTRLPAPKLARALTQNGEGRSYGLSVLLRQELWRGFFGWVSYAVSRSERRNEGDLEYRLFDFDQPHVLSVVASQEVGRWTFGARVRFASGSPRTPVVGSYYDAKDDRYEPVFGAHNAIRIPSYFQIDARAERTIPLGGAARLAVFLDVQNVTYHANAEEIVYSPDYRTRGTITGLPALAVAGGRFEW